LFIFSIFKGITIERETIESECPVCFQQVNQLFKFLNCSHSVCKKCYRKWVFDRVSIVYCLTSQEDYILLI